MITLIYIVSQHYVEWGLFSENVSLSRKRHILFIRKMPEFFGET